MPGPKDLGVLVVAQAGDPHADAVEAYLQGTVRCARTSLIAWDVHEVTWSSVGELLFRIDGMTWRVDDRTTVWWRRPGWFENPSLGSEELSLARDECAVIFPGALDSAGVRWVDQPWVSVRAGNRLVQLRSASSLGVNVPPTVITNSITRAGEFVTAGPTISKAISSGPGLAPFADRVSSADMPYVKAAPVLLQREMAARADWRVVSVGEECFGWRRPRSGGETVDWRVDDPGGSLFEQRGMGSALSRQVIAIQHGLHLAFSVQDWLETDDGMTFLEVNPQGQWLFLSGADETVAPALAVLLTAGHQ